MSSVAGRWGARVLASAKVVECLALDGRKLDASELLIAVLVYKLGFVLFA